MGRFQHRIDLVQDELFQIQYSASVMQIDLESRRYQVCKK